MDCPGRVGRVAHDEDARRGRDGSLEVLRHQAVAVGLARRDRDGLGPAELRDGGIGDPVGRRHDHFVAGVEEREHRLQERLLAAVGADDLGRLVAEPLLALEVGADLVPQRAHPVALRVLDLAIVERRVGRRHRLWTGEPVGLAHVEADDLLARVLERDGLVVDGDGLRERERRHEL